MFFHTIHDELVRQISNPRVLARDTESMDHCTGFETRTTGELSPQLASLRHENAALLEEIQQIQEVKNAEARKFDGERAKIMLVLDKKEKDMVTNHQSEISKLEKQEEAAKRGVKIHTT